ncbi:hypothetical protein EMPS_09003 [Entomortierella parvispora]|uniref:Uncharacterized protein n=1 Tax=Entomortierella parvispora TaxID=205924 RepID=A0A9P3LZV0_9FUNG|nr:hypothetical protein EMPS_09003 [Entomortierella parvispora]
MTTSTEADTGETMQRFRLGAIIRDFEILTSGIPGEKGFVFLEDVQYAFDTEAARLQAGTMVIPFMRGPDHRKYIPERIPCRPGIIIDIVEDPMIATQQLPVPPSPGAAVANIEPTIVVGAAVETLMIEDSTAPAPLALTPQPTAETVVDRLQTSQSIEPSSQTTVATATSAATTTAVAVAAETSTPPIDPDLLLSAENPKFKQFVHGRLEELVDKSEQMIRMQQEALDRLALVQTKAEAILVQNFELLEYTIPRLFIVLPETSSTKWNPSSLLGTKFRLHFICECGDTKRPGSKIPHHLHLAKHEGYTITQPNKFFVDYGPYLLVMLTLLKHGISIAGVVVPALSTLRVVDVVDSVKESCETVTRQVIDGVDQSISFLEEFRVKELQNKEVSIDLQRSSQTEIAEYLLDVKGLEGADLRQLASYLSVGDSDNLLGNLYRITTKHGHVKWVCKDHYREGYQAANNMKLCKVVKAARGTVDEQVGKVVVTVKSAVAAAQLYDALLKSQGIYELELTMAWNQENSDLTKLKDMIKKSTIKTLTLDLQLKTGPTFGINLSGKRRNDPILSLLKHPALTTVHLREVPADFFHRAAISPKDDYTNLKTFEMGEWASLQKDASRICILAARSPYLERIRLNVYNDEVLTTLAELLDSRWEESVPLKVEFGSTDSPLGVWFEMLIPKGDRVDIDWKDFPGFLKKWGHHVINLSLCNEITEEIAVALALATTRTDTKQSSLETLNVERSIAVPPEQKTVSRAQALRQVIAQSPLKDLTVDMAFAPDTQLVSQIQWQHLRQLRISILVEAKTLPLSTLLRSMQAAGKSAILVEDFTIAIRDRGCEEYHFAQLQGVISLLPKLELLVIANTLYPAQWLQLLALLDFNCLEYLEVHVPAFRLKNVEQFIAALPLKTSLKTLVMEGASFGDELAIRDPLQVTVMKARGIRVVNSREKLGDDHPYFTRYSGK